MIKSVGGDDDGDFGMVVCTYADTESGVQELAGKLGPLAESVDDEGLRRFSVGSCRPHEGSGFGYDFAPKSDTVDDDRLVQGMGRTESGAEGFELQMDGCRAKSVKPAFADGDKVGVIAILLDNHPEPGNATFIEVPGVELDTIVLLLLGRSGAVGSNDNTHPLGRYREDGPWTVGSVRVDVGKGKQGV